MPKRPLSLPLRSSDSCRPWRQWHLWCAVLIAATTLLRVPSEAGDSLHVNSGQDSLQTAVDTTRHAASADTLRVDTLGRMSTPELVGTLDRSLDSASFITNDALHWVDYRSSTGILRTAPGATVMDQSIVGGYSNIGFSGGDWRGVAFLQDGRLLNDPASGIFNPDHFSPEYADRIEIVSGPRAFLYGLNSPNGAVNFVTKNYNSNKPFTKIIYSEGAYNYQITDGTFSQNISRKINFTAGFQHQSTDGRHANSSYEDWNLRVKGRYNVSKDLNIILSEYLTSTFTNLNGGVNFRLDSVIYTTTPLAQHVMSLSSYEKLTRHDVDLSFVGTFLGDSTDVSLLNLYYSHNFREFREGERPTTQTEPLIHSDHASSWMGATFSQDLSLAFQRFSLGGNIELRQIEGSPNLGRRRNVIGSLHAKEDLLLGPLTVSGYARYDRYLHKDYFGAGADASLRLGDEIQLFGGVSYSRRLPSYEELYWSDSTVIRPAPLIAERIAQLEAGAELRLGEAGSIRVSYFHRDQSDPILFLPDSIAVFPTFSIVNGGRIATNGFEAKVALRIWMLSLEGTGTTMLQQSAGSTLENYPKLSAQGGLYFWNTILQGRLDLKAGFRGRYLSSWRGELFNPEVLASVPNTGRKMSMGASVDFVLIAHIGDAYIHFLWENLTNEQYFTAAYYPIEDRAIRFGVAWEFLN